MSPTLLWTTGYCRDTDRQGHWQWRYGNGDGAQGYVNHTTENRMHFTAILEAIRAHRGMPLIIYSGSEAIAKTVSTHISTWEQRDWLTQTGKEVGNADLLRQIWDELQTSTVEFYFGYWSLATNELRRRLMASRAT